MGKAKKKSNASALWIVAGIAVVAAGALIAFNFLGKKPEAAATPPVAVAGVKTDSEQNAKRNQMGSTTAKVTVVEWGDYL